MVNYKEALFLTEYAKEVKGMNGRIGQQLGNYRLVLRLGSGGFAEVYLGEHVYLKTQAAIKVLPMQLTSDEIENFSNEARIIANLKHPNIISVLDFGIQESTSTPFLVMDYAPNGTLRQRYGKGTKLSPTLLLPYIKQVAEALQYAHDNNVVHRDVKPENMLIATDGRVLLSDFGIAITAHSTASLSLQPVAGTPTYIAPEQMKGMTVLASDQYALGIVVYEMLCGVRPFNGTPMEIMVQHALASPPPMHEHVPSLLAAIEDVVMRALAKDPKDRFPTIQDFAHALEQAGDSNTPTGLQGASLSTKQEETRESFQLPREQTKAFSVPALPNNNCKDFFISYNEVDREWAVWIAVCLQNAGYSVLLPPVDFRIGFIFRNEMKKAFLQAKRMIVTFSPAYLAALKSRSSGFNAFKRATLYKQEFLLSICVHSHNSMLEELSGIANYINLTGYSGRMAQAILLAYISGDGIELPALAADQNGASRLSESAVPILYPDILSNAANLGILQQIKSSFAKKDWMDVTRKTTFLLKNQPDIITDEIWRMHGLALIELDKKEQAYESFHMALTLASDQQRLTLLEDCVKVLILLDRWSEILEYSEEALRLAPATSFWLTTREQAMAQLVQIKQTSKAIPVHRQETPSSLFPNGIDIFFSYSHKDEEMRQELEKHLSNLKRQRIITGWHDGEIRAGDVWEEEIETHLSSAHIILLLVSPDFIDSNYCYEKEMLRAMERHKAGEAHVIPIILRPAHWERTPFGKLQALPTGAKPITLWQSRDEALVNVARGIQKRIDELTKNFPSPWP